MSEAPFSFPKMEHEILHFWDQNDIFAKTLRKTQKQPPYVFYDGPPFATGLPHHGHLLPATLKDVVPRYFTMKGFYVSRRFGWDCHGLPIEYEIDKQFGKSAQEIIDEFGIAKYTDACRAIVLRYANEWRQTVRRIGRWVDMDNDYKTMDPSFMESVWWVFKQLWDKGLIYQGEKVVPFSTALGTALSNFEATSNYQDVQDPSVVVLASLLDQPWDLAIWTTTPWTLPSNLGVCIGNKIDYVLVEAAGRERLLVMAKARVESFQKHHQLEIVRDVTHEELVGQRYEPMFPYFSHLVAEGAFRVLSDDYVSTEDGTGLVHMAPAFGEDDNRIMRAAGLKTLACPIDFSGKLTDEVFDYRGQYFKDADKNIIADLKKRNALFDSRTLVHSYPFCYRSDTPLIYRTVPSWYVNVDAIKTRLIEANQKINWVPSHIRDGRFGKWLEGARDWAISRNRVWGTPLPIWKNDVTGNFQCIGSVAKLQQLTNEKVTDLHRDHIDHLTFTIAGEQGVYRRISEVLDCWFESGSMPYAQSHYPFEHADHFDEGFPAQFIAEGLDQTRGWFYTLTVLAVALFNKPAFKNVIVNGLVLAADGKKMSKRLRNYTPPEELMESIGADALRLYLINSALVRGEEQRFTDEGVRDVVRRTLLPWYNAFKFFHTYAKVDGWNPRTGQQSSDNIMDQWLNSRMQSLKKGIEKHMNAYELYQVVPELLIFIDELTNCYIRLNRSRFWSEGDNADKRAAYTSLYNALMEFTTCMAPFAPFLSEHIYQELRLLTADQALPESVHLCDYPLTHENLIDADLEDAVNRMQQIILLGRQKRNDAKVKVKIPLRRMTIVHKNAHVLSEIEKLGSYIQAELNVKELKYDTDEQHFISLYAKPNSPVLGKRLGGEFKKYKASIEALNGDAIAKFESEGQLVVDGQTFTQDDLLIFREAKENTQALSNRFISIDMDTTLSDELIAEGLAREVVNRIQKTRKELNLNVDDRISIHFDASDELANTILQFDGYIRQETLAVSLKRVPLSFDISPLDVDGHALRLQIAAI